jgi:uncharacterized protein (DUF697 family)
VTPLAARNLRSCTAPSQGRRSLASWLQPAHTGTVRRDTRSKVLWAVWMTGGGIVAAAIVYALTNSVGWAVVGLLASGVVLNAIAQMVTQPVRAVTASRHRRPGGSASP